MKIVICINTSWNILNFRKGLIKALLKDGHEVVAVAPRDNSTDDLIAMGCRFFEMPMANGGTNPIEDIKLYFNFKEFFKIESPDVFLSYTAKPNIYGSLAARSHSIPVINNIAGLGAVFISKSIVTYIVKILYKIALRSSSVVFFQNDTDRNFFIQESLVQPIKTSLLPGSGVDLKRFSPQSSIRGSSPFRFILIGRMLKDKGVFEYINAARILSKKYPNIEFTLLGATDCNNPAAISRKQVDEWVTEGFVMYLGTSKDVRIEIAESDCVVLPSYREGTPRTLLEAAAMAKPIVTTDAVGCREVVTHGLNGLLCKVADMNDLCDKLEQMLLLSEDIRSEMGLAGRTKVEREFDENLVIEKYRAAIASIAN